MQLPIKCPSCGYDVSQTPEERCPECGTAFNRTDLLTPAEPILPVWARGAQYPTLVVAFVLIAFFGVGGLAYRRPPEDLVSYAVFASLVVGAPFGLAFVFAVRGIRGGSWLVRAISTALFLPLLGVVLFMFVQLVSRFLPSLL